MKFAKQKWIVAIGGLLVLALAACSAGAVPSGTETPGTDDQPPTTAADESATGTPQTGSDITPTAVAGSETGAGSEVPLDGSLWTLTGYVNTGREIVSPLPGSEITLEFKEQGVSGNAGCNGYFGSYTLDGAKIAIGPVGATEVFCEPVELMEQESAYLAALQSAATYHIDGSRMEIRNATGAPLVTFQLADQVDPEIQQFLAHATYSLELARSGQVTLIDGEYREPAAEAGATELVVQLTDHTAVGTLNEQQAVVTVLIGDPDGSGTFYYLSLFTPGESGLENTAVLYLGDRIGINAVDITGNTIVIDMVQSGPEDPLCCPTQHVINVYELQDSELVLASSTPVEE